MRRHIHTHRRTCTYTFTQPPPQVHALKITQNTRTHTQRTRAHTHTHTRSHTHVSTHTNTQIHKYTYNRPHIRAKFLRTVASTRAVASKKIPIFAGLLPIKIPVFAEKDSYFYRALASRSQEKIPNFVGLFCRKDTKLCRALLQQKHV